MTFSLTLHAQDTAHKKICLGYSLGLDYSHMDFRNINSEGCMLGLPYNNQLLWSTEVTVGNPDKVYGSIYGQYSVSNSNASGTFNGYSLNASVSTGIFGANAYYSVLNKRRMGLYLSGGVSMAILGIYSNAPNGTPSGDTITVFEEANVREYLMLRTGVLFEFYRMRTKGLRLSFALNGGYDFALLPNSGYAWYDYPGGNIKLQAPSPKINLGGPYCGLSFNFWVENWHAATTANYEETKTPIVPDSGKKYTRGFGLFLGGGIASDNFNDLRSQNSWLLTQPPNIMPTLFMDLSFGDPRKVVFTLPLSLGYSSANVNTINYPNYNVTSYAWSVGLMAGHSIYNNENNKILKSITASGGIKYAEEGPNENGFALTINQTMLNAELLFDLFRFYSKEVHIKSQSSSVHAFTAYSISLKTGYSLPITQAQWSNGTNLSLPSSTSLGGLYACIGVGMSMHYRK